MILNNLLSDAIIKEYSMRKTEKQSVVCPLTLSIITFRVAVNALLKEMHHHHGHRNKQNIKHLMMKV